MTIKPLAARDHRIDVLRALALLSIFVNHIPGNVLEPFTNKNFGLSDSAEAFVLMAGIASAFAYFPAFAGGDARPPLAKIGRRVVLLYIAHLSSTVVGMGLYCYGGLRWGMPIVGSGLNLDQFLGQPMTALVGLPLLVEQIAYHNILPLYVCLLTFLPVLMAAARFHVGAMLALSVAVYALAQFAGLNLPTYPEKGGWFFNPFAWQLVFAAGLFIGIRVLEGRSPLAYRRWLWWSALGYLVASCLYHRYSLYGTIPDLPGLPHTLMTGNKTWEGLPRLLHVLSLAYVIGHYRPVMAALGRLSPQGPLALIGRHSLPVFWLGTALAVLGQVLMFALKPGALSQFAYIAAGMALQWLLARFLDSSKPLRRPAGAERQAASDVVREATAAG